MISEEPGPTGNQDPRVVPTIMTRDWSRTAMEDPRSMFQTVDPRKSRTEKAR